MNFIFFPDTDSLWLVSGSSECLRLVTLSCAAEQSGAQFHLHLLHTPSTPGSLSLKSSRAVQGKMGSDLTNHTRYQALGLVLKVGERYIFPTGENAQHFAQTPLILPCPHGYSGLLGSGRNAVGVCMSCHLGGDCITSSRGTHFPGLDSGSHFRVHEESLLHICYILTF